MSYSSRLIANARALFGCGRVLFACTFFAVPLINLTLVGRIPQKLGPTYFKIPPAKVEGATAQTPPAVLRNLHGELSVVAVTDEERSFQRRIGVLPPMVLLGFAFLVCHWMWQLCRNVEQGEIFSPGNLRLVRRIGVLLIVEAVVTFAIKTWTIGAVASHVRDRVSFVGLDVVAPSSSGVLLHPHAIHFDLNQIVIGLLVLCLAEVFRQGLQLKQESELTV
jgi:hypothetical protein